MLPPTHAPRRRSALRPLLASSLLAVAALAAIDAGWWFSAERSLDRAVATATAGLGRDGWRLSVRTGRRGGWPLAATLVLRQPALLRRDGARWSGEMAVATISPLDPGLVRLVFRGTQALDLPRLDTPPLPLRAWGSRIVLSWSRRSPDRMTLSADALHVAVAGLGPDDAMEAASLRLWTDPGRDGLRLRLSASDLALPLLIGRSEGRVMNDIRLALTLPPPGADHPELVLDRASVDWGTAAALLTGRVAPVGNGLASGTLRLHLDDPDAMTARLREAGLIDPGQETAIRAVLDVIGAAPQAGPGLSLDLTLDRNLLQLGAIPLLRLPPLPGLS